MRVRVRLFAGTRDAVGAPALDVEVAEGARVGDLLAQLVAQHPRLAPYRPHALLALDGQFVPPTTTLREGCEVALMPPVSGGAADDVEQRPQAERRAGLRGRQASAPTGAIVDSFSLDELVLRLEKQGAGAVVAFVGYVRGDEGVERLRFEAYATMAEREIAALREQAAAKFSLTGCLVQHRVATLAVGDPIVAVVTAAPHRRDAFEAAMWLMDELKTRVPIWKAEEGASGARWINDPTA